MDKAILILDMPRVCSECDLFKNYYDDEHEDWYYACALLETIIDSDIAEEKKCDDCPLKSLPKKKEVKGDFYKQREIVTQQNTLIDFDKGYNKAIDEILGEKQG